MSRTRTLVAAALLAAVALVIPAASQAAGGPTYQPMHWSWTG